MKNLIQILEISDPEQRKLATKKQNEFLDKNDILNLEIVLPKGTYNQLKAQTKKNGTNVVRLCRKLILDYLDNHKSD